MPQLWVLIQSCSLEYSGRNNSYAVPLFTIHAKLRQSIIFPYVLFTILYALA